MKNNWQIKNIEDCIERVVYTSKIQRKDFLESGNLPIISQEQNLVNGYWNNQKDVFRVSKPLVIFGDHTQILKYIDFDFVLGADGVKILQSKDFLNPKYLYYFLQNINLRSLGYARHYRLLKEKHVNYPESIVEQKRIVKILDDVFKKIEQVKENAKINLQNSKNLFDSYLNNIFSEPKKEWTGGVIGDLTELINRGISPRYTDVGGISVINQRCVRNHRVDSSFVRRHDVECKKISEEKYIKVGDVLVNSTGVGTLGRVAQVVEILEPTTADSHVTIVRPKQGIFLDGFFGYVFIFFEKEISKKGEGASGQIELSRDVLKNDLYISYPKSHKEQKTIVKKLDQLSEQTKKLEVIYKKKMEVMEELKKSILQKAFNGEL